MLHNYCCCHCRHPHRACGFTSVFAVLQDVMLPLANCWQMSGASRLQETASGLCAAGLQQLPLKAGDRSATQTLARGQAMLRQCTQLGMAHRTIQQAPIAFQTARLMALKAMDYSPQPQLQTVLAPQSSRLHSLAGEFAQQLQLATHTGSCMFNVCQIFHWSEV